MDILQAARLDELQDLLGPEKSADLIILFRAELSKQLACIDNRDAPPLAIAAAAHKLAGIAGALGLSEFTEACQILSSAARTTHCQEALNGQIANVGAAASRACTALDGDQRDVD